MTIFNWTRSRTTEASFVSSWFVMTALLALGTALVHAQNPMLLRWDKAAPFPEPEEELYGVQAGGKMYVIGGFSENGKPAPAMVYEWDPAADKWTKKKSIPVPVHHQAQAESNGKIYVFGGCQRPLSGPGMGGWAPVDNSWEYDPRTDTWRALAPMPWWTASFNGASIPERTPPSAPTSSRQSRPRRPGHSGSPEP